MNKQFLLYAVLTSSLFASCKPNGANDSVSPQKGYVTGTIVDTQGWPISGAFVFISSTGPYSSGASTHTDARGNYRIKMDYGAYRIYATFDKEYAQKNYEIQLKPNNSDSFSVDDSPVIDFKWVLSGKKPIPLQGYFGGYIGLYQGETNIPKNDVEFTFTPIELIDGSTLEKPIVLKPGNVSVQYLEDLPLGTYAVKAVHKPSSGGPVKEILLRNKDTQQTSVANGTVNLAFTPESAGFYRANLEFYER
ncbi:carboxypeptidase-like regulatory domain-containing protein [Spirosoma validum]|uniref:Carboxypeptidase regulatory-like domain-containing protein n=1 Tax=Spirosoma validum TaxID=2771355 RepID=A0A927GGC6_9BACT|nr:carboxypeptidase-like regulatory domain-containing protein [Spirosoma validum]MBD2756731.1 carboxypeptidase regulatory-like domain-containing protein [Spirosoma validum]